jgi:hypothetical protein
MAFQFVSSPFPWHRWEKVQSSLPLVQCPDGTEKGFTYSPIGVRKGDILDGIQIRRQYTKGYAINCFKEVQ